METTDKLSDGIRSGEVDVQALLQDVESFFDVLAKAIPPGDITVDRRPAPVRILENVALAQRTMASVHVLMSATVDNDDYDGTEDATVLVRRLLELLADTYWITEMGDDPDVQALRSELGDLCGQYELASKYLPADELQEERAEREQQLAEIADQIEQVRSQLKAAGRQPKRRQNVTQILEEKDSAQAHYWAFESNVAHLGVLGRAFQRNGLELGSEAEEWRRRQVVEMALAIIAEIGGMSMKVIGTPDSLQDEYRSAVWNLSAFSSVLGEEE